MSMNNLKVKEVSLSAPSQPLNFNGELIGTVERIDMHGGTDGLRVQYTSGSQLDLPYAVDISKQLAQPRIFIIEGSFADTFLLFGGKVMYWLTRDGVKRAELRLFRSSGYEEYWTTSMIDRESSLLIVYESGVLAIGKNLDVIWHREKLFNDIFVSATDDTLTFLRDRELEWTTRLSDGKIIS
jgi:hypothetical protein